MNWFNIIILYVVCICGVSSTAEQPLNNSNFILSTSTQNKVVYKRKVNICDCLDLNDQNVYCSAVQCTKCDNGSTHAAIPTTSATPSSTGLCTGYTVMKGALCETLKAEYLCKCPDESPCYTYKEPETIFTPYVIYESRPIVGHRPGVHIFLRYWNLTWKEVQDLTFTYDSGAGLKFNVSVEQMFHKSDFMAATENGDQNKKFNVPALRHGYTFSINYYYPELKTYNIRVGIKDSSWYKILKVTPELWRNYCFPRVQLQNCASTNTNPDVWYRGKTYTLQNTVTANCTGTTMNATLKIHRLGNTRENPPFLILKKAKSRGWKWNYGESWYKTVANCRKEIVLDSFELEYGLNAAVLDVYERPSDNISYHTATNVAVCYFVVKPVATRAHIQGGRKHQSIRGKNVLLSGVGTTNPNVPSDKQKVTLGYSWSCWDLVKPSDISLCKGPDVELANGSVFAPNFTLMWPRLYMFQLKTYDKTLDKVMRYLTDDVINATVDVLSGLPTTLQIAFCEEMCGCSANKVHAEEIVHLQVSCTAECPNDITYNWTIIPNISLIGKTVFDPSDEFAIKGNTLTEGQKYVISVTGGTNGIAKQTLTINKKPIPGKCEVTPQSGNAEDLFSVTCTGFQDEDVDKPLTYRVYQEEAGDAEWRYLTAVRVEKYPWTLNLRGLQLIEGKPTKLIIEAVDFYGSVAIAYTSVEVKPPSGGWSQEIIQRILDVSNNDQKTDIHKKIRAIFVFAEGVSKLTGDNVYNNEKIVKFKHDVTKSLLQWLDKIQLQFGADIMTVTHAVHSLLNHHKNASMHHENARLASALVLKLSKKLHEMADNPYRFGCWSKEDVKQISTSLVHSASLVLVGTSAVDIDKESSIADNQDTLYPDYKGFDTDNIEKENNINLASKDAMEAMNILGGVFSKNQADSMGNNAIVTDTLTLWTKTGRPCDLAEKYLPGSINITSACQATTIYISKLLCYDLDTIAPLLKLTVTVFQNNPQGFKDGSGKLNAEFVSIAMVPIATNKANDTKLIFKLKNPIDIFLKLKQNDSANVGGNRGLDQGRVKVDTSINWEDLEDNIAVHRVILEKGARMIVIFEKGNISAGLAAVITQEIRPNMKDFETSTSISKSKGAAQSKYDMEYPGYAHADGAWFYLGVLPNKIEIAENHNKTKGESLELKYSFQAFQVKCLYMVEKNRTWLTDGCVIGPETQFSCLHCQCTHLSLFTGSMNSLLSIHDPFIGVGVVFILTHDNMFVVSVVVAVLGTFLLGLIWAYRKEKRDLKSRMVTFLEDNKPNHKYAYLLIVHTGHRRQAGTSSSIGLELEGQNKKSGPYILLDPSRRVLQRGSECAFLLMTSTELGDLRYLHLWSNNSGRNPKWYCSKVVVTDVENRRSWEFLFNTWLSVTKGQRSVHMFAKPASKELLYSKRHVFVSALFHALQDVHIWASVWWKHPLNNFTRIQRLSVAVSGLLIIMLVAIFLDGVPRSTLNNLLHEHIEVSWWIVVLVISSAFAVEIPLILLITLFKRSHSPENHFSLANGSRPSPNNRRALNVSLPHNADHVRTGTHNSKTHRVFLYVAWVLCVATILICSITILYYGLVYTESQSYTWGLYALLGFLLFILIVEPMRMLFCALYDIIRRKKYLRLNQYLNYINKTTETKEKVPKRSRNRDVYRPLMRNEREQKKKDETLRNDIEHMLFDLVVFLFYICTLFFMVLSKRDDLSYQSTKNMMDTIVDVSIISSFRHVYAIEDLFNYLNNTFIPNIYVSSYYNGDNVSEIALTADYGTRLLGIPRLRQLRVKNQTCTLHSLVRKIGISEDCIGEFNIENEDSEDYNIRWTKDLDDYELMDEKVKAVWKYSSVTVSGSNSRLGEFFTYHGGGYVANLGRTASNSRSILNFLHKTFWIDERTRAVFIEYTTYNANRNLFNVVTLMIERSASTAIVTTENVATVRLLILPEEVNAPLNVCFIIAITLVVFHYLRNVFHLKRDIWHEFISFWNVVDLCIIILCVISIIIYSLRDAYVRKLLKVLEMSLWNEYVSFDDAADFNIYFAYSLSLLVCLSTCRLWRLLHFNKVFRQLESTLSNSVDALFSLFILMALLIITVATSGSLIFGHFSREFRSPYNSVLTLVLFANRMFPKINMDRIVFAFSYISIFYFFFFWLAYTFYFFNLFFAVLTGRYFMLRSERAARANKQYGPMNFLEEESSYLWNKLKRNVNVLCSLPKRLRGGKEVDLNLVAVPKPSNRQNHHTRSKLRTARLKAMVLLTLDVVKSGGKVHYDSKVVDLPAASMEDPTDLRFKAMLALVLDNMNALGDKGEVSVYGKTTSSELITDQRLNIMETTLNRFTRNNVDVMAYSEHVFDAISTAE